MRNNSIVKDERIVQSINKIRSEMALIIYYGVVISFLVKTLILNMGLRASITEYAIMVLAPLYQFIRMHSMKISLYSPPGNRQTTKRILISIAILILVFSIAIFKSMYYSSSNVIDFNWQSSVANMFSFIGLFIAIFFISNKFNRYRAMKYEEEFNED